MTDIETTVLVVGGGPVGLLAAHLLGRRGVKTLLAEKHLSRLEAPKAHALNPRSLEICAAAGLPMADILGAATPTDEGRWVRMVETLAKPEIGSLAYERQDDAVREVTPWPLINIEQPRFEAIVEREATDLRDVEIRRGLEWQSCVQISDQVISTLTDRSSGETVKVRSRYLIAADGAGSRVRDALGIAMDGPERLSSQMMIHFEADLRPVVGDKPAILYFLFGPGAGGVLIAYDIGRTWVLMHPCGAAETPADFDAARCLGLVRAAIGVDTVDIAIKGVRSWVMSAQIARRYRDGRVFLVGDAGHRFPPTGGLGLNTGVGDIDNLAWKIAAVEAGWAGPDLLESYESERRVIAQTNMGQSLANALRIRMLFEALGYGTGQTVDADTFAARLADPAARIQVDAAVTAQKDHFDSLRLQLGFAYGGTLKDDDLLPISQFTPKAVAGARLPHMALADGRSTLDLIAFEGFTLLTGPDPEAWRGFKAPPGAPLRRLVAGTDFVTSAGDWAGAMGLSRDGALLVRPDGHILDVAVTGAPAELARLSARLKATLAPALEGVA